MRYRSLVLFAALILICSACGPQIISGRPPFISISELSLEGERLSANFNISNHNGEVMDIDGIEIKVQVEEAELTRYNEDFKLTISANSTEMVEVEQLPDDFTRVQLTSLESGDVASLPFRLEGRVHTVADGFLQFRHKGHLYPVPVRPG